MDKLLAESTKKREDLVKELERVRSEVLQRKSENENTKAKNKELEHELERLENYAS